jgi:hypothetical protein
MIPFCRKQYNSNYLPSKGVKERSFYMTNNIKLKDYTGIKNHSAKILILIFIA